MKLSFCSVAIFAVCSLPAIAVAQTAPAPASIICNAAKPGVTPDATINGKAVTCRTLDTGKILAAMTTVKTVMQQAQATPDQMKLLQDALGGFAYQLQLPVIPGGNGGIEE